MKCYEIWFEVNDVILMYAGMFLDNTIEWNKYFSKRLKEYATM